MRTPNGEVEIDLVVQSSEEQGTIDWLMTFPDGSVATAFSRVVKLDSHGLPDIVLYGLAGLMFYQVYVTIRVVLHKPYTSEKKRQQLLLIWLVPLVGAAMALAGLATEKETPARRSPRR